MSRRLTGSISDGGSLPHIFDSGGLSGRSYCLRVCSSRIVCRSRPLGSGARPRQNYGDILASVLFPFPQQRAEGRRLKAVGSVLVQ